MTNINIAGVGIDNARTGRTGLGQGGGRNASLGFSNGNDLISAIIQQKNASGTVLQLADGQALNVTSGLVIGEVGDAVFFELSDNDANVSTLKQVFPNVQGENFFAKMTSIENLEKLMQNKGYVHISDSKMDIHSDVRARIEDRQQANEAASRLARNIGRISGSVHSAAVAQLAAEGINIDKMPVHMLSGIVAELETAKVNNEAKVGEELSQKIVAVHGMNEGQIAQVLAHEAALTLDNLYAYKHSGAEPMQGYLSQEDFDNLQKAIDRFFEENNIEKSKENLERVRLLLNNEVPLTKENFDKLVFLQDVNGNVDIKALLPYAVQLDAQGDLGNLDIYEPLQKEADSAKHLKDAIYKHEARLAMSYEAAGAMQNTNIDIDLKPQIEALNALKAQEAQLLAALKELNIANELSAQKIADTFKAIHTLPYMAVATVGSAALAQLDFKLANIEQHIASQKYDENATMVSLKYGDTAVKIAEQFVPLLEDLGLSTDKDSVRAAKVLTANQMDINAENLAKVKDIVAKIDDIQSGLHPRIAAAMIADGLSPASMHIDEILEYIAKFENDYGTSDKEQLLKHILQMDKEGDIDQATRKKLMEIYQALHKILRHDGAGIGFAVNAGIALNLQALTDFAKNYNASRGKNNTINYTAEDGVYYAKHVVTSFAQAAQPKPLAEYMQQNGTREPLPEAVEKLKALAQKGGLDLESVNSAIKELSDTNRGALRALLSLGLPVTLTNLRHLQDVRNKKTTQNLNDIDDGSIVAKLPKSDLSADFDPAAENAILQEQVEEILENAMDADDTDALKKISSAELALRSLNFKQMMLAGGRDFGFNMNFNERMTDVQLHLLSEGLSVADGVKTYVTLTTAMGEIEGLLSILSEQIQLTLAADAGVLDLLKENRAMLPESFNVVFKEKNVFKKELSQANNLPIY